MREMIAICSCPRLGFMDFMGESLAAFAANNVHYNNAFGAYWTHAISGSMDTAVKLGYEYIFTTDYDSIITAENVADLIKLMDENPETDAICAVQVGRFSNLLASTKEGISRDELAKSSLVNVATGHFGLTIFRVSSLVDLDKPWFHGTPSSEGEWHNGTDKIDDDISFWRNFDKCGKKLFLAPRVVIGHLELLIKWPDKNLLGMYGTLENYREDGPPGEVWK